MKTGGVLHNEVAFRRPVALRVQDLRSMDHPDCRRQVVAEILLRNEGLALSTLGSSMLDYGGGLGQVAEHLLLERTETGSQREVRRHWESDTRADAFIPAQQRDGEAVGFDTPPRQVMRAATKRRERAPACRTAPG